LVFYLNDLEVRRYASQGQHRTFGMALKLAQFFYLEDVLQERPLLLLDDVFDHLDEQRAAAFLRLIGSEVVGQSILTATRRAPFAEVVSFDGTRNASLYVENGVVTPDAA